MNPELEYPITPFTIIQPFGANSAYYAKFPDAKGKPQKGHMGIDLKADHGHPVYFTHDGNAFYFKDSHGGEGMINISIDRTFQTIHWHLVGDTDPVFKSPIPLDGKQYAVKKGDLAGYANNTGAPFESNGTHLHFGYRPLNLGTGAPLHPDNGYDGCEDPMPLFNGKFAQDVVLEAVKADVQQAATVLQNNPSPAQLTIVQQILQKIASFLATLGRGGV